MCFILSQNDKTSAIQIHKLSIHSENGILQSTQLATCHSKITKFLKLFSIASEKVDKKTDRQRLRASTNQTKR